MDMKRVYRAFCIVTMVLALVAVTPGCDSSVEGYRTFTWNKVAHFSFEYPAHYSKYSAHADADVEYRGIFIGFRDQIVPTGRTNGFMHIYVENAGYMYPDANAAFEHHIWQFVEPENILDSSTITVAGISAGLLVYFHEPELMPEAPSSSLNVIKVTRVVYFDYNGLIWKIVIESDEDRADVAEADFDHLLETFQILD